jgi:hypothetical protein
MTAGLAVVHARTPLHRVARRPDPWAFPSWSFAGDDGTFGNRYDDPAGRYRVLYASSRRRGAFLETLARFRPDPAVLAALQDIAPDAADSADERPAAVAGVVPIAWLERRCIGAATPSGAFCDIAHSDSLAYLRRAMAAQLLRYGLEDLDAGDVRRRAPRALTQELSRYVFEHGRDAGGAALRGIRYRSRLGDDVENWAIFEGDAAINGDAHAIAPDDPDLVSALTTLGLTLG